MVFMGSITLKGKHFWSKTQNVFQNTFSEELSFPMKINPPSNIHAMSSSFSFYSNTSSIPTKVGILPTARSFCSISFLCIFMTGIGKKYDFFFLVFTGPNKGDVWSYSLWGSVSIPKWNTSHFVKRKRIY